MGGERRKERGGEEIYRKREGEGEERGNEMNKL